MLSLDLTEGRCLVRWVLLVTLRESLLHRRRLIQASHVLGSDHGWRGLFLAGECSILIVSFDVLQCLNLILNSKTLVLIVHVIVNDGPILPRSV